MSAPANDGWIWVEHQVILAIHDEQLVEHGGRPGLRDAGLLESALARGPNAAAYGTPDRSELAAALAYGLAKNHPFIDGNKRTAFVAMELFLALNGATLSASDADCVLMMLSLAAGDLDEAATAAWIRERSVSR